MRILFVCSGNICRSPMAAEYARGRAASAGLAHVVVESAGLLGIEGAPASPEAVQVLREEGFDLTRHRSQGLAERHLRSSDLVIVMTHAHRAELERRFPGRAGRLELLRSYEEGPEPSPAAVDLADPIVCSIETYRDCFGTIRASVDQILLALKHER